MIDTLFEKVYCINLKRRPDRLREVMAEFEKHAIRVVEIFEAFDGRTIQPRNGLNGGQTGCILSHLQIITTAKHQGYKNVVIFEDDVQFCEDLNEKLLYTPSEYDMLYLGGSDKYAHVTPITEHISKISGTYCTHAYAINERVYDAAMGMMLTANEPLDMIYAKLHPQINAVGFRPKIAWQRESFSDIINKRVRYKSATNEPNPMNEW